MDVAALRRFLTEQIARAKADDVLFSVHLKATMMKVSDPIIFGHVVQAFFPTLFEQYGEQLAAAGISPNDGLGALLNAVAALPGGATRSGRGRRRPGRRPADGDGRLRPRHHQPARPVRRHHRRLDARHDPHERPHVGPGRQRDDTLAVIPDSSYAGVYQTVIDDCRANGAFDPSTMGSVPNVGLMAQAAEEYGSRQDLRGPGRGPSRSSNSAGDVLIEHEVQPGDIWRACQTKDARSATGSSSPSPGPRLRHPGGLLAGREPCPRREPDREGEGVPPEHDTDGLTIEIMPPPRPRRTPSSGSAGARTPSR